MSGRGQVSFKEKQKMLNLKESNLLGTKIRDGTQNQQVGANGDPTLTSQTTSPKDRSPGKKEEAGVDDPYEQKENKKSKSKPQSQSKDKKGKTNN